MLISTFLPRSILAEGTGGGSPTNTAQEQDLLKGVKTWEDNDDAAGKRPDTLDIYLYKDGGNTPVKTFTTDAAKDWKYQFDLSEYPLDSTFTIDEEVVPFYSKSITQPVITTVSDAMGAWTKYSPNNNLLFPIDINQIVVVTNGNEALIWSQTGLDDSEKDIIIESLNGKNAPGYGNPKTIKFIPGFVKVSGTKTSFDDNVTFHADSNIEFEKTNVWSLIFQGNFVHEHRQIDDSEIINTCTYDAEPVDVDLGGMKNLEGRDLADDEFEFGLYNSRQHRRPRHLNRDGQKCRPIL